MIGGFKYFITFTDDYSRFRWGRLLFEKFEALDAFKKFKATIKLKLGKLIKCLHLNKYGEFYGRYDELDRNPSPFTRYLEEYITKACYTMLGILK